MLILYILPPEPIKHITGQLVSVHYYIHIHILTKLQASVVICPTTADSALISRLAEAFMRDTDLSRRTATCVRLRRVV